jgi:hypothetical protein
VAGAGFYRCVLPLVFVAAFNGDASGQGRTDVVTLPNGDRITGEIVELERGRLEFKTDDAGTLMLEWDKVASLTGVRQFEVVLVDGRRYLGSLGRGDLRSLALIESQQQTTRLPMSEVTRISPIGSGFWSKIDGTIDAGYNYTRSSGVAQLNVNSSTAYRAPAAQTRLTASVTMTQTDDGSDRDDRGAIDASYLRYPWRRWFIAGAARLENNESLGIKLRSQLAGTFGPRLVDNNRGQLVIGGGLAVNDERGVDVEPTQTLEGVLLFRSSFYTYDRPTTSFDIALQYYPGLSSPGRHRVQLDTAVRQELWKDLFVSASVYNSFDNRPPNPASSSNDVGIVFSIGWKY